MKKIKYFLVTIVVLFLTLSILPTQIFADTRSDIEAFVTRFYELTLDRPPDSGGLNYWTENLLAGNLTGADTAYHFIYSDEFLAKDLNNSDYLDVMYRAFFNREPESEGKAFWIGTLESGATRLTVLAGFVNSEEFKGICASYGITPGKIE